MLWLLFYYYALLYDYYFNYLIDSSMFIIPYYTLFTNKDD
jgi:hypothetical protein